MAAISQGLLDLINRAEADLEAAEAGDRMTADKQATLAVAEAERDKAAAEALGLHQAANTSALSAIQALKEELKVQ